MRQIAVLVALGACSTAAADPPSCSEAEPLSEAALMARLTALASPDLDGRAPGTDGDKAARKIIEERFQCLGLKPAFDKSYVQAFESDGKKTANVVAILPGTSDEIVLVSAHHDHLGAKHLGANDNASGIVAMLGIADAMVRSGKTPKRTVVFAAFGAEEDGMVGSYYFAKNPPASVPIDKMVQDVNLDMVGSYSSKGWVAAMGTFKGLSARTIIDPLVTKAAKANLDVIPGGKARGSDFEPFCKQGVPYVFLWTPDERCYHETCDTVEKIDKKHFAQIAVFARELVEAIVESDLDLAASRKKLGCGL